MANRSFASGLNPQSIFTNRARRQDVASRRRRLLGRAARAAHSAAMEALEQRQLLSGVLGSYYDNMDLSGFVVQRSDANINFNWGSDVPVAGIGADTFSVRWLGTITTPANETGNTYTFKTTTDDGVREHGRARLVRGVQRHV